MAVASAAMGVATLTTWRGAGGAPGIGIGNGSRYPEFVAAKAAAAAATAFALTAAGGVALGPGVAGTPGPVPPFVRNANGFFPTAADSTSESREYFLQIHSKLTA